MVKYVGGRSLTARWSGRGNISIGLLPVFSVYFVNAVTDSSQSVSGYHSRDVHLKTPDT
jgi:hypothetical protein